MRQFAFAVLCSCLLLSLGLFSAPAQAGDYYGGGYYGHRGNVWYSSSCCYRKVVRHERSVRYVRTYDEGSYYRSGYDRPYRHGYYDRPYRSRYYYGESRRYYGGGYYTGDAGYGDGCYRRSVRVADGRGGWVWGTRSSCY